MRGPRSEPPASVVRGQQVQQPQGAQNPASQSPAPRGELDTVAQARGQRSEPAVGTVVLTQLNMDAVPRLTTDGVRKVQQLLKDKGFNPGPIDGEAGPLTNAAVKEFQERYGIQARGGINNQTLFALGAVDLAGEAN